MRFAKIAGAGLLACFALYIVSTVAGWPAFREPIPISAQ